jgi:hypothetical protein
MDNFHNMSIDSPPKDSPLRLRANRVINRVPPPPPRQRQRRRNVEPEIILPSTVPLVNLNAQVNCSSSSASSLLSITASSSNDSSQPTTNSSFQYDSNISFSTSANSTSLSNETNSTSQHFSISEDDDEYDEDDEYEEDVDSDDCFDENDIGKKDQHSSASDEDATALVGAATVVDADATTVPQSIEQQPLKFVSSKFGNSKLVHNGYSYTKEYAREQEDGKTKYSWRCEKICRPKREDRCYGRAYTIGLEPPVHQTAEHNHIPQPERVEALLALDKMMTLAKTTDTKPRKVKKKSSKKK